MHTSIGHPNLVDVGTCTVINDFLKDLCRSRGGVDAQIAVGRPRIQDEGVELITFAKYPNGEIERNAAARCRQPEGCDRIDARVG